ncbi:RecA protein [Bacillus phage SP-15]|uniref:RecA protein n=1 Tax=Bacillus phage SP-15 TaxID=1792032 RepID=A0A127AWD6_9CAUD|nr:DNA repair protein [Bacillus phage SP-15]AMM44893.1 RecA protein [Bacillus phage SP-15]
MAKKDKNKATATVNEEFDLVGLLDDLSAGSKFKRVSEVEMLHSRPKVPTPLPHLNAIFGGGIPFGVIAEGFGPPRAGKSTFWYETLAEFQKAFPHGVPIIVDTEMSVDDLRMRYMGVQTDKVLRLPALTLEDGFDQVTKILKKKAANEKAKDLPLFIMWDTIAVAPSKAQHEEGRLNAGGMSQKPRLIKQFLSDILVYIEEQPTILVLLNQVFTDFSGFKPKLVSGGFELPFSHLSIAI